MNRSVLIDELSEPCPLGQATAYCVNNGPFVFLPCPTFDQGFIDISFWRRGLSPTDSQTFCRWVATQRATSLDKANLPRLWSIEKTATGTVLRTNAWRKALLVGYPNAALNALPPMIGPCIVSKSASSSRASSHSFAVVSVFFQSLGLIAPW